RRRCPHPCCPHVFDEAEGVFCRGPRLWRAQGKFGACHDRIGRGLDQRRRLLLEPIVGHIEAALNDCEILAFDEAVVPQLIEECGDRRRIATAGDQEAEAIDATRLLRARQARPRRRRAADELDECASSHSITSSARASKVGGKPTWRYISVMLVP